MSEEKLYVFNALEVIRRDGQYFVRYDAGSHCEAWGEDKINEDDFSKLKSGRSGRHEFFLELQKRLTMQGMDPYVSNWTPTGQVGE